MYGDIKMPKLGELNEEEKQSLDKAVCQILDIIESVVVRWEREFGASNRWRSFRKDQLLLPTIQKLIKVHMATAPIDVDVPISEKELVLTKKQSQKVTKNIKLIFKEGANIVGELAEQYKSPPEVIHERMVLALIERLIKFHITIVDEIVKKYYTHIKMQGMSKW